MTKQQFNNFNHFAQWPLYAFIFCFLSVCVCYLATHRELFVKLLEAEEENLLEGKGEVTGDFREAEGGGIAAEEEVEDELLAGGEAGDERTAVARESGGDDVVRRFGVSGKRFERGSCRDDGSHGRGRCNRRNEVEHQLNRLARLVGREEVAELGAVMRRTCRDLIAARDQLVYC